MFQACTQNNGLSTRVFKFLQFYFDFFSLHLVCKFLVYLFGFLKCVVKFIWEAWFSVKHVCQILRILFLIIQFHLSKNVLSPYHMYTHIFYSVKLWYANCMICDEKLKQKAYWYGMPCFAVRFEQIHLHVKNNE